MAVRNCFRCGREFSALAGARICDNCRAPERGKPALNPKLSFREKQVIRLVCRAMLNKEIAYELHLTEGTVKEYINRIFSKTGAVNRTDLAVMATKNTEWFYAGEHQVHRETIKDRAASNGAVHAARGHGGVHKCHSQIVPP